MAVISVCGSYFDDRIFLKWKRISISFWKWLIKSSIHLMWIDYICMKIILTKGQYLIYFANLGVRIRMELE